MRENEYEADEKAVSALISIGMNPQAAVTALEKLRALAKANDISEEEDRTGLLDTHPNLTARIEAVKKQIEKEFSDKRTLER
ncbi:MAG: M48 family metalloprotease [Nitrospirae bacterium]|nr:M48 family metalloprotease [Nitrospirota bacterium]MCL5977634.1 M48 family metalloprotease [Nitrospirota bacterium]